MMTRDELTARKNTLEAMRQQHLANANACAGAIQECDHWLSELERTEEPTDTEEQDEVLN